MTARFLLALALAAALQAQSWTALPNYREMAVGTRLCRWWALHASAQVETACQVNGVYQPVHIDPVSPWINGVYPLGTGPPTIPEIWQSRASLVLPLFENAITWLIQPVPAGFYYQIVGWPAGGAPNIQRGTF